MGNSESRGQSRNASSNSAYNAHNGYSASASSSSSTAPQVNPSTVPTNNAANSSSASTANRSSADQNSAPGVYNVPGQSPGHTRFQVTVPENVRPNQQFRVNYGQSQSILVTCPPNCHPGQRIYVTVAQPPQQFLVRVPPNIRSGDQFRVQINNETIMVTCPPNVRPGDRVTFHLPQQNSSVSVSTTPGNNNPPVPSPMGGLMGGHVMGSGGPPAMNPSYNPNSAGAPGVGATSSMSPPQSSNGSSSIAPPPTSNSNGAPPSNNNDQVFEVIVPEGVAPNAPFALLARGQKVIVRCPPGVRPGQKIRFMLPSRMDAQQIEACKLHYDKDGWTRCLGEDQKFYWVYKKADDPSGENRPKSTAVEFDMNEYAYVRQFVGDRLECIEATKYSMDVLLSPQLRVSHSELSTTVSKPFDEKVTWFRQQLSSLKIPWEQGHIKLIVRRSNLLNDSVYAITKIQSTDMRKIFRIGFHGEPALDAGGVSREFYQLLAEQVFNPDCGLFLYSAVNQMCMQINPNSGIANESHLDFFHTVGRIMGKALLDNHIIPVRLIPTLYKHLMGWPVTLQDVEYIDHQVYRNLHDLCDLDCIEDLELDFTVTEDQLGRTETIDLIPNGSNIIVTKQNLPQYLSEQAKYRTLKRISAQVQKFLTGFYEIVPEQILSVFTFQELELVLHGVPEINLDDWIASSDYLGEFLENPRHPVVLWFWDTVRSFSQEQKAKLLQFATGTSGVPAQGFKYLQGNDGTIRPFTLHGDKSFKVFPRAHTCFNRIDLPIYKSREELQKFLLMAIDMESMGFAVE